MRKALRIIAVAASLLASVPASAVTYYASYRARVFEPFQPAAPDLGTIDFTIAFDPYYSGIFDVLSYTTTIAVADFNVPVSLGVEYFPRRAFCGRGPSLCDYDEYTTLTIGGARGGPSNLVFRDFALSFDVNRDGVLGPFQVAGVMYTRGTALTASDPPRNGYAVVLEQVAISAVPEPSIWTMMIVGLGITGGGLRRRRSRQLARA